MSAGPRSILIDTNVWIDFYLGGRPGHAAARELLLKASAAGVQLLHAVSSTNDVFFLVAADFKRAARRQGGGTLTESAAAAAEATAWACLENMTAISTTVGCDQSDVWLARKYRRLHADYEDDLIIAAAMRAKASLLVTNDEQLIRHSPVATLSVESALKLLA